MLLNRGGNVHYGRDNPISAFKLRLLTNTDVLQFPRSVVNFDLS